MNISIEIQDSVDNSPDRTVDIYPYRSYTTSAQNDKEDIQHVLTTKIESITVKLAKGICRYRLYLYGNLTPYEVLVNRSFLPPFVSIMELNSESEGWLQHTDGRIIICLSGADDNETLIEIDCA